MTVPDPASGFWWGMLIGAVVVVPVWMVILWLMLG
jgi:hypothetical protein